MAITWGSTTLNITDHRRIGGEVYHAEHEVIPDPTLPATVAQSVLQAFGRKRIRVYIEGYGTNAEVATFDADKHAATSRVLTIDFDNSFSDTMIIINLEPWKKIGADATTWYTMELVEV